MLNLNLKLQSSVLKGQVKTIELELRKLEARQAGDMLGLIKVSSSFTFPPSVSTGRGELTPTTETALPPPLLLRARFRRRRFAPLLPTVGLQDGPHRHDHRAAAQRYRLIELGRARRIGQRLRGGLPVSSPFSSLANPSYSLLSPLPARQNQQTRAKLSHFSSLNKRFAAQLKRCPPDVFLKMGRVYHEVLPVERRMDAFVELLRKEELKEAECGREVEG